METDNKAELYAALAAARADFGKLSKGKTAKAGSYSYNYADLADIIEATAAPLAKQGIVIIQDPEVIVEGGRTLVLVHGCIVHKSGATHDLRAFSMPAGDGKPQAIGSAISYARRYQMQAALNLAAEDDDGKVANDGTPEPATNTSYRSQQRPAVPATAQPSSVTVDGAPAVSQDGPEGNPFDDKAQTEPEPMVDDATLKRLHALGAAVYGAEWDGKRHELIEKITQGRTHSSKDLTLAEAKRMCAGIEAKQAQQQQPDAKRKAVVA